MFFFFDRKVNGTKELHLGVLNLQSKQLQKASTSYCKSLSQTVESNCKRLVQIKKDTILEKFIHDLNNKDVADQKQLPNPTIV